ncbi:DUF4388 domain-containing protein, partial [bacterium]|nr:DUF4388 domain-containing protein [bacterium]
MSLQGMIEEMGLGEIIQALSLNRHKGTLRIETDEGISKFFYLSEGEIILIRTVKSEPVRIGELLLRAGKIDQAKLDQGLALQKRTSQRLGDALVALGHVNPGDVDGVIRQKFEEEFLDIFLLDRGRFEFIFGLSPESLFSPDEKLERIALNTSSLMLEAMRRVDDCQNIRKELGSLDEIYRNRVGTMGPKIEDYKFDGVALSPDARREVYEIVDGTRTIRDILARVQEEGASRGTAFLYLHVLKQNDLIRPLDAHMCLNLAKDALERADAAATAKFLRALMSKEKVDAALVKRYIEFLRKSARPAFALREAKYLAAQYLASGEIDQAIALYQEAKEIDERDTEVLDRLFYAHLRKSDVSQALDVGFQFKDYMQRETDLPVVARVVKNLRELAPEDPRVIELSGLLLRRQDRIDEARKELERALEAHGKKKGTEARRAAILQVLTEIDPEKSELVKQREA